jgi:hypothetical protein
VIEKGVIQLLLNSPAVTDPTRAAAQAAVAAAVGSRVQPDNNPQDATLPRITVTKTGEQHPKHMKGRSGICKTSVRVQVHAATRADAEAIGTNVGVLLDGYSGALAGGLSCQGIFQQDASNEWDQPVHGDEQGAKTDTLQFDVWAPDS